MMSLYNRFDKLSPATVNLTSNYSHPIWFFWQWTECQQCSFINPKIKIPPGESRDVQLNARYETEFYFLDDRTRRELCKNFSYNFGEGGKYLLEVLNNGTCKIKVTQSAEEIYQPILWGFLAFFMFGLCWIFGKLIFKHMRSSSDAERLVVSELGSPEEENVVAYHVSTSVDSLSQSLSNNPKRRIKSLDAFRGIALTIMIFVDYGGGLYSVFQHSPWNGLTVADLVFPWFMWIMGTSLVLSVHSLLRRAVPKRKILLKILIRSIVLFCLGVIINGRKGFSFEKFRVLGVLQRFAITYLIVGTVDVLVTQINDVHLHAMASGDQAPWWTRIRDICLSWPQWIVASVMVIIHTSLTFGLKVPNCPRGYLGPGGLHMEGSYENCTGGAAGYIDREILGINHLYEHSSCKAVYHNELPYDPEGILGIMTATFLVFLGLQAGKILVFHLKPKDRIIRWLAWAVVTGVIGTILCKGVKNDGFIPVNKNLWSLSFVLVMASFAFILLSTFYFLIDVKHWWSGAPFFYAGMNSILLYVGHEFTNGVFPWGWPCDVGVGHSCYLGQALWGTSLWVLISAYLYYRKFFLVI